MPERVEAELRAFVAARNWEQFHTPENLAKSIAIEAGELLECSQWSGDADRRAEHQASPAIGSLLSIDGGFPAT